MGVDDAVAALESELDNGREALSWALAHDPPTAVGLAPALSFALTGAHHQEQRRLWQATAEHVTDDLAAPLRAAWALGCSRFWFGRKPALSARWARVAVHLYQQLGHPIGRYLALNALCRSDYTRAGDEQRTALAEMHALENPTWPAQVRFGLAETEAMVEVVNGASDRAMAAEQRAASLAEQAGHSAAMHKARASLAYIELMAGRVDDAVRRGRQLVAQFRGSRDQRHLAFAQRDLVAALLAGDAVAQARVVAEVGLPLGTQFGLKDWWPDSLALLAALEGRARIAARLLGYGDAVYAANGNIRFINEARAAERAGRLARERLGEREFERLKAEGAALNGGDIAALAFAKVDH